MPHLVDALFFGLVDELGHAAAGGMGCRAAQFLVGHLFAGHRLDDIGAGDVHLAGALDHEDEVGDGWRVNRAAGRGTDDHRNLGDDPRVHGVAQKDVAVGGQAQYPFLDAGPARVVEPDHGATGLDRQVQHLADLLANGLRKRAAHHGEVLGKGENLAALHLAVAGDHRVAQHLAVGHAEVGGPVGDKGIQFFERPLVHEQVQPLAGGQFTPAVLLVNPVLPAAFMCLLAHGVQGFNLFVDLPFFRRHSTSRRVAWSQSSKDESRGRFGEDTSQFRHA